jgi:hypothetical protein
MNMNPNVDRSTQVGRQGYPMNPMKKMMKKMKLKTSLISSLAALLMTPPASAEFKWVPLNAEQFEKVQRQCWQDPGVTARVSASKIVGGTGLATVGSVLLLPASQFSNLAGSARIQAEVLVGMSIVGTLAIGGIAAGIQGINLLAEGVGVLYHYFSPDEVYLLVREQQFGQPGLITRKVYALADELSLSSDAILAATNLAAIHASLCTNQKTLNELNVVQQRKDQIKKDEMDAINREIESGIQKQSEAVRAQLPN